MVDYILKKVSVVVQFGLIPIFLASISVLSQIDVNLKKQFFEQDLSLSYTNYESQVSTKSCIILSFVIPLFTILFCNLIPTLCNSTKYLKNYSLKFRLILITHFILYLFHTLLITSLITDAIKTVTTYPRPDFFDYCDYNYFHSNYTKYLELTTYGTIGDVNNCHASSDDIKDSIKSFPSGHSSMSFAGMLYASFMIKYYFSDYEYVLSSNDDINLSKSMVSFYEFDHIKLLAYSPMILAIWIGITRIQDNKHYVHDVIVGAILGMTICHLIYKKLIRQVQCTIKKKLYENLQIQSFNSEREYNSDN
jgi:diacylglycerol diphosphate phosphatase/phosphatidate phosphatase